MDRMDESAILTRIRTLFPGGGALDDDCGALPEVPAGNRLLVTTDVMEEGQHFRRDWHPPRLLGRKLLAVNLSDLDASGARPLGFTFTLAVGREVETDWLEALLEGLAEAAREWGVPVIGGDTVGRPSGLGLGITAFGATSRWLRRDAVQVGDRIFVDQRPGASLRGLRKLAAGERWDPMLPDPDLAVHLDPRPNLGLGLKLAACPEVHGCIDLSDGLSKDLRVMAEASGLSIVLQGDLTSEEIQGGEDYARCFSSSLPRCELEKILDVPLLDIGFAVPRGEAPLLIYDGGSLRSVADRSFDHFND